MPSDLSGYKNILLFGGSFDPPHRAHIELPQQAAKAIGADLVAYIPAGRAPHKLDREQTDPQHRLAMLRLALSDQPGEVPSVVLSDEIDRGADQPSYTVDTLESLKQRVEPGTTLRLLIGADQLRIFDSWRNPERIIELAEPAVMVRPPDTQEALVADLPSDQREDWATRLIETEQIDVSSTDIRAQAGAGIRDEMVCDSVAAYINQHGLYQ
ncbi:MAG: nicotinate (nicotinamide) nucleotide adenylyltransferase [Phycisphaeraceae bacterium]|nr:nicotinate (nicotinamide) nucleotide adenylyltransferase [Phycisphaeraceae bacterium]